MLYIITGLVILFCLITRPSKILLSMLGIHMFLLYAFNTNNADFLAYIKKFEYSINSIERNPDVELGFYGLSKLIHRLGGNYNTFLFCIALVGLTFIIIFICKFTNRVQFVLALYFIFPFILDIVQVRFFIATFILIWSSYFLIEKAEKNWMHNILFIMLVLLAGCFHYSALLWLPLITIKYFKLSTLIAITAFLILLGSIFTYGNLGYHLLMFLMPSQKAAEWLQSDVDFGFLVYLIIHASVLLLVFYSIVLFQQNTRRNIRLNTLKYNFVNMVFKVNIVLSYIFIFYAYSVTFFRIYRISFILNYIVFSIVLSSFNTKTKNYYLYLILVIIFTICFFSYMILPGMERTIIPIFENNSLFNAINYLGGDY